MEQEARELGGKENIRVSGVDVKSKGFGVL
jgi:hypothetical protein